MSDALNLTRSWVQPDGTIIDPATCGAGACDLCDGAPCECPHHATEAIGNAIWTAFERSGHVAHVGWQADEDGIVRCACGEIFLRLPEVAL